MATVFRIEKQKNYTVMSNHHLKNSALSLKAKGLLSQMLSLPDNWDYSLKGLAKINKESIDAIRTAVWELEKAGYIVRSQGHGDHGKFSGIEYIIYETPQLGLEQADSQKQELGAGVERRKKENSETETTKSLDTHGDSPWLENPTSVKTAEKVQPNISPWLDNPTSENPTSGNPTSEQLNINNINKLNILNSQSVNQQDKTSSSEKTVIASAQIDGQTDFTQTLEILDNDSAHFAEFLIDCEFEFLPASAQPLFREALEKMYFSPEVKINRVMHSQRQVRERLKLLDAEMLQEIHIRFLSANKPDKPIVKPLDYLISMLYNNSIEEEMERSAFDRDAIGDAYATVVGINRGFENPWEYRDSKDAMIRRAAELKIIEQQNSG